MGVAKRLVFLALCLTVWLPSILGGCSSTTPAPVYGWNWQGPVPEGFYLVRNGDSLGLVAQRLGISARKLAKWNGLKSPYVIYAETLLRTAPPDPASPRRIAGTAAPPAKKPKTAVRSSRRQVQTPEVSASKTREKREKRKDDNKAGSQRGSSDIAWAWPLNGPLIQGFRAGDRTRQGIRIGGRAGEAVRASAAGLVVYSGGGLKAYGNLIIIKHNDNYLSAYGFNRSLFVKEGDRVTGGQAVAEVGQGAEGTHLLHFEVRRHGTAVDPIAYLPPRN
jgi:lipoprotein NlpD